MYAVVQMFEEDGVLCIHIIANDLSWEEANARAASLAEKEPDYGAEVVRMI